MADDLLGAVFAALADPTRRAMVERLASGEATVSELAQPFSISIQAVSKHLGVLQQAGLITRSRRAQERPCRLRPETLASASGWLDGYRQLWEQQLRQSRSTPEATERITPMTDEDTYISITRTFDAPPEEVFRAWTTPAIFGRWFGTAATTVEDVAMDVRVGGGWQARMVLPEGNEIGWHGSYQELEAPARLVMTLSDRPGDQFELVTVELKPVGSRNGDDLHPVGREHAPGELRPGRGGLDDVLRRPGPWHCRPDSHAARWGGAHSRR